MLFISIVYFLYNFILGSYLWNAENCHRFIDSLISSNEIQSKTNYSNSITSNMKKMIVLNNDTESLLKDIYKIMDHFEKF
jgi:hypothetical protein